MSTLPVETESLTKAHARAWELASKLRPHVPKPKSFLHLYKPMKFKRFQNEGDTKFTIQPIKSPSFEIATFRHALMFGVQPTKLNFGRETQFHNLVKENHGVLTSDQPVEIYSQYIAFHKAFGNVLVSGLGLAMAPTMMLEMKEVESVTVIEKESKIIQLIADQIDPRIKIIKDDIYKYLKRPERKYDFAYHDIWYGTGEAIWVSDVVPLYRLTHKAGIKHMGAWGEAEMQWQMNEALLFRSQLPEDIAGHWKPYKVFLSGLKKKLGRPGPYGPEYEKEVVSMVKLYTTKVGTPLWEKTFDWDGV